MQRNSDMTFCEDDCCFSLSWRIFSAFRRDRACSNLRCRLCCFLVIATLVLLVSLGFTIFFSTYSPQRLPTSVKVGGNVSVLLDPAGFDPFWYDQVEVITASNDIITLFRGLCDDLSTEHVPLPPKKFFFKAGKRSRVPFNYFGSDTPVYSADGTNSSFIRFNISAVAGNHDGSLSCGIQLFNFANFTSYNDFLNNELTNNITQQDTQCIPVGPPGSPLTSSVTFYLNEPGFYRQAMIVNSSVSSVNSSVSGSLLHHNFSSLDSVHCSSDFQNTRNCTIRISALPSTPMPFMCVLVLAKNYTTVYFRGLRSIWNVGTITIATIFTIMFLLCSLCCCIFIYSWTEHMYCKPRLPHQPSLAHLHIQSLHSQPSLPSVSSASQGDMEQPYASPYQLPSPVSCNNATFQAIIVATAIQYI